MAKESTKCPMCGAKLKLMDGRMTCRKCGYYTRSQNAQDGTANGGAYSSSQQTGYQTTDSYSASTQSGSRSAGGYTSGQQTGSGSAPRQSASGTYTTTKSSGDSNPAVAIVTAISLGVVSLAALVGIVLFRSGALDDLLAHGRPETGPSVSRREESSSSAGESPAASRESGSRGSADDSASSAALPRSEFFCLIAEAIWEKPYQNITAEEYASLTALQINRDDKVIYYQLSSGDTQSLTYQTDSGMELSDLSSFTGLEWFSIDDELEKGDLKGLNSLYAVYAENTFEELADIIPHPENITDLGVYDSIFKNSLDGIDAFPNLLYLDLNYTSVKDISALSQFPDLLGLRLADCDDVNDYSPLMTLTNLEELSIQSSQLKSIDFIRQMPNLTSFGIEDTQVSSISALESCPGLTQLSLIDNTEIDDYSVISGLTRLTNLDLELNYGGALPSLAGLTQLQQLSVKYAGDLSPLRDVASVTYLTLEDCSGWELDAITSMQGLTTLVINDFSSYVDSLEPLTRLPNLTTLSLEDTSVFGNIEEIFGIPTLRYLYLDECQVGMDFDSLPNNETLEILSLSDITILKDPSYNNGDAVSLSEHYDMFEHFPNLTELYLASLKLDSIDFVEKLPRLQYLDITDNNVTSLKPLENLSNFQAVWCGQNTILENLPEDSPISVITSD